MIDLSLLRIAINKAMTDGEFLIACTSPNDASNLRQRFYRYRDKIREDVSDQFNLLVDHLRFEVDARNVVITYHNPNQQILESINEQESGAKALNPSQRPDTAQTER